MKSNGKKREKSYSHSKTRSTAAQRTLGEQVSKFKDPYETEAASTKRSKATKSSNKNHKKSHAKDTKAPTTKAAASPKQKSTP